MITDTIAIGDKYSSYLPFDIIINADFPYNQARHGEIKVYNEHGKRIYAVGLRDHELEPIHSMIQELIPLLEHDMTQHNARLLFHCYAGISRSVTLAMAWMKHRHAIPITESYSLIQSKRSQAQPNEGFMQVLQELYP